MTAKEYLQQAYKLERQIKLDELKLEAMRSSVYGSSINYEYSGGQNGQKDGFSLALANVMAYETYVKGEIYTLTQKRVEIEKTINTVSDDVQKEILTRRYLLYQKWELIAVEMDRDLRWIYRLHGKALENLKIDH